MNNSKLTSIKTLITGGSSGIGLATAKLLAQKGHTLLLVSLVIDELAEAKRLLAKAYPHAQVYTLAIDLSRPENARQVHHWAQQQVGSVDYLINNAGFGTWGFVNDLDMEKETDMIQLHVTSLYRLNRLFLQDMLEKNAGRIINISSVSAFQPNPRMATYGATKSFVLHFSRAINQELRDERSKVRVVAICPTPVKSTQFQDLAGMNNSDLFQSWMVIRPERVARTIVRHMSGKRDIAIPGKRYWFIYKIFKRLPDRWQILLSGAHLKPKS